MNATTISTVTGTAIDVRRTIGILGGGQLGRMMAEAARRMGTHITVLDPTPNCPASFMANNQIVGNFNDTMAVMKLAEECDVMTMEIEHVNVEALKQLERLNASGTSFSSSSPTSPSTSSPSPSLTATKPIPPIRPSSNTISTIQDKFLQKQHLQAHNIKVGPFCEIKTRQDIQKAIEEFGLPLMLKSRKLAYDGRGNYVIRKDTAGSIEQSIEDAITALRQTNSSPFELYAEKWVEFKFELAVMVARGVDSQVQSYPCVLTTQQDNICHTVIAPAPLDSQAMQLAQTLAEQAVRCFDGAGIYGVEMFYVSAEDILLNEIAPRPHNSGHFTIEGCHTSQFAQHLRCVLGLPLGSCKMAVPAAMMINVLGTGNADVDVELSWLPCKVALYIEGAHVHWYEKQGVSKGRKLGHITITANSHLELLDKFKLWQAKMQEFGALPHQIPDVSLLRQFVI